jgi:hypothetical protein
VRLFWVCVRACVCQCVYVRACLRACACLRAFVCVRSCVSPVCVAGVCGCLSLCVCVGVRCAWLCAWLAVHVSAYVRVRVRCVLCDCVQSTQRSVTSSPRLRFFDNRVVVVVIGLCVEFVPPGPTPPHPPPHPTLPHLRIIPPPVALLPLPQEREAIKKASKEAERLVAGHGFTVLPVKGQLLLPGAGGNSCPSTAIHMASVNSQLRYAGFPHRLMPSLTGDRSLEVSVCECAHAGSHTLTHRHTLLTQPLHVRLAIIGCSGHSVSLPGSICLGLSLSLCRSLSLSACLGVYLAPSLALRLCSRSRSLALCVSVSVVVSLARRRSRSRSVCVSVHVSLCLFRYVSVPLTLFFLPRSISPSLPVCCAVRATPSPARARLRRWLGWHGASRRLADGA